MAHNLWSDLTQKEMEQRSCSQLPQGMRQSDNIGKAMSMTLTLTLPDSVDWSPRLQPIKDQGQCGYENNESI
jgi:hypothetical protein